GLTAEQRREPVVGVHELDLGERHARRLQRLDGGIEGAGMPGDRDHDVAQFPKRTNGGVLAHHDGAGAHRGVEADDFSLSQGLHALDRAPFAYRIDLEGALLQLRFLPALGKILHPSGRPFGIVLVVFDGEPFGGEEALLDGDAPGTVVGIAVALQADGATHVTDLAGSGDQPQFRAFCRLGGSCARPHNSLFFPEALASAGANHGATDMRKLKTVAAPPAVALAGWLPAQAAEWPVKPIRLVVPTAAGGAGDLMGRTFANALAPALGQQFV